MEQGDGNCPSLCAAEIEASLRPMVATRAPVPASSEM